VDGIAAGDTRTRLAAADGRGSAAALGVALTGRPGAERARPAPTAGRRRTLGSRAGLRTTDWRATGTNGTGFAVAGWLEDTGAVRCLAFDAVARRACDATRFARVETSAASRRAPVFAGEPAPVCRRPATGRRRGGDDAGAWGRALERVRLRDAGLRAIPSPCP